MVRINIKQGKQLPKHRFEVSGSIDKLKELSEEIAKKAALAEKKRIEEEIKMTEELEKIDVICTMKATKNLVGAVGKTNRLKYPNLKELYRFSTGKELEGHHNSKYDVLNLHEAIQCLVRKEMLTLPSSLQ